MKDKMKSRLVRLLNIYGVSGEEKNVRKYIRKEIKDLVDYMETDSYGNLLAVKKVGRTEGKPVIMLNAHMDTVSKVLKNKVVVEESGVFRAYYGKKQTVLGADDRAGIAVVISILDNIPNSFEGTIKVSFTREEEIGCIGASKVDEDFYSDVDLSVTFDRKGNKDIVVGTWGHPFCSNEVGNALENISKSNNFEYRCIEGGISDAYEFSFNEINSVNISVGYENEHTNSEFLVYKDMHIAYEFGLSILKDISMYDYKDFGYVPRKSNNWVGEYVESGFRSYENYDKTDLLMIEDGYDNENIAPYVWTHGGKVIIDNTYDAIEFDESYLDSLISQLKAIKNSVKL